MKVDPKFDKIRLDSFGKSRTKATEQQWWLCDQAIRAFQAKYPRHWVQFQNELKAQRTRWGLAKEGDLKKANFRHILSFPTIEDENGNTIDSLKPVLDKIIPNLGHKNSINLAEFIRRYGAIFSPAENY